MKLTLYLIFGLLLNVACANLKLFQQNRNAVAYTKVEKQLIKNGNKTKTLTVLIINKPKDSIILRTSSTYVNVKRNKKLNTLFAKRLEATMIAEMGVGIAAPQVGILKNMICVQRFDKEGFPNEIFINPVITRYSIEKQDCREGCLSIPGRSDTTNIRSLSIDLAYQNLKGKQLKETVTGFTAVIFQHEIDHLNGILYIDHLQQEMANKKH